MFPQFGSGTDVEGKPLLSVPVCLRSSGRVPSKMGPLGNEEKETIEEDPDWAGHPVLQFVTSISSPWRNDRYGHTRHGSHLNQIVFVIKK